ncbi:DUF6378 domain-containing protein [Pasteurella atlantica]|uniref:DUF6378 domain-containing protein n=2 Tax=Pasteurellaceae TaxID=712 RepID=A0ACC6HJG3_9PAST|nr:DUF6378 domain-containing protein [Pasteurella atlantica]MDP8051014.1 DUF6378 domain-containing protein [Pasteurella atlantica]MDP8104310.1 DUF6378 domain-containing protein [Pasteurella atlantica]MDP8147670.1 DUF6378 domain-containing protein [Pasteurella atlantica]
MENNIIQETLKNRGNNYGSFEDVAQVSQHLKGIVIHNENEDQLTDVQREALEMICVKLARISMGDPDYEDNWRDIAGYAILGGSLEKE